MDDMLQRYIAECEAVLAEDKIRNCREKPINYGRQIVFTKNGEEVAVNFYKGKKGVSAVVQGKASCLKDAVQVAISGKRSVPAASTDHETDGGIVPKGITSWIGCDESGKGDVFGPLVCAACAVTAEEAAAFRKIGVCDSKALDDRVIAVLAQKIQDTLGERCVTRTVMPKEYNSLYAAFKKERKNLNHLLGNLHAQNIRVLLSKYECPCIIVDKFGKEEYVLSNLQGLEKTHTVIQVTKGERDTAVAAASILARNAFVTGMEVLTDRYHMPFPKGAYLGISKTVREAIRRYGTDVLSDVGKLNFKNFDFLR